MTKEQKLTELEAAATGYFAAKMVLKDWEQHKSEAEARLKNHFYAIGISWKEWQEYIKENYSSFLGEKDA